jgi:dipeptidase D
MNSLIKSLSDQYDVRLSHLDAGNLRNAIPREAFAIVVAATTDRDQLKNSVALFYSGILEEFKDLEKDLKISACDAELPEFTLEKSCQKILIEAINCCPHGVVAWSSDMEDLVETSTNLASAKFSDNNSIIIVTTQRSSVESAKRETAANVVKCLHKANAVIKRSDGYPGWKPDMTSEILGITRKSYTNLFRKEPMIRAIHAGLECGLIYEKVKGIDMISFGPTIRGAHTPEEKIEIDSVQKFWDLLTDIIRHMPPENQI